MGGPNSYDINEGRRSRRSNQGAFNFEQQSRSSIESGAQRREVHPELNPKGKVRVCEQETPIVTAMDFTQSRGRDAEIVYNRIPEFFNVCQMRGYVRNFAVSFCGFGDATAGDRAPLQVGQFETDNKLDVELAKMWIEQGGGGTGEESAELVAYYYAYRTELRGLRPGKKGYFFFITDEGFYPKVSASQVKDLLGVDMPADIDFEQVFKDLQKKFNVYLIFPRKTWEERKDDIDAEIRKRVTEAGGQYNNVDIRASLLWNDRNDLDLHVVTPHNERIYYGHKRSRCGGCLDVDRNVRGETTKPVENIRWKNGKALKGKYQVIVQNYAFHEASRTPIDFRVELEVNGRVQSFKGVASPNGETGYSSDILVAEFDYDPNQRVYNPDKYAAYKDGVVIGKWAKVIPPQNILKIDDPQSIIEVMMGVLALASDDVDLDDVRVDMAGLGLSALQQKGALKALEGLAESRAVAKAVTAGNLPTKKIQRKPSGVVKL
ncbi:hypothetical protein ISS03_01850 [Patescibacteria group bacterium]|nr:hypothetical protein [Patescibacteria group bacterium]